MWDRFLCEELKKKHYSAFKSYKEVYDYLRECSNKLGVGTTAGMLWNFGNVIKKGDVVVANNGRNGICGIGLIEGDYIGPTEANKLNLDKEQEFTHFRKVKWMITDRIKMDKKVFFDQKTITPIDKTKWEKIKEAYIEKDPNNIEVFKKLEKGKGPVGSEPPIEYLPVLLYPDDIEAYSNLILNFKVFEQISATLNSGKHLMLTGAPGTGKTNIAEDVCKVAKANNFCSDYILTTATSDWTTYDTIGGYMPSDDGQSLKFEEGKFLQAIKENKWLIIDEINRADIDKAFGQLFTVLSGQGVELPFKEGKKPIKIERISENRSYYDQESATYKVGDNWRIIATMNVFDKDYLFEMSYAFMRRFTFVYINLPSLQDFKSLINDIWGEDVDDNYLSLIEGLLEVNPYRQIGPAIFKDMVEYAHERDKIKNTEDDDSDKKIIKDTIISFILPQFEGLELQKIHDIWNNILSRYDVDDDLKARLEEISGATLITKLSEEDED